MCKSSVFAQGGQHENYKFVIQSAKFIIRTKTLTSTAYKALMDHLLWQNIVHYLPRAQMKQLFIEAN